MQAPTHTGVLAVCAPLWDGGYAPTLAEDAACRCSSAMLAVAVCESPVDLCLSVTFWLGCENVSLVPHCRHAPLNKVRSGTNGWVAPLPHRCRS